MSASTTDTDPVLTCERDHLIRSRESLAAMRAVASTAGDVGGDAFSSESLGAARARRLKALADDPSASSNALAWMRPCRTLSNDT